MDKNTMAIARGLSGTKRDLDIVFTRSLSSLAKIIKSGKYASTADSNGAIGAWIDDSGKYRCEAYRNLHTIDSKTFTTLVDVRQWYRQSLKKIAA